MCDLQVSTGGGPKVKADKVVHATMMPLVANLAVVSRQVPERAYYLAIDCPKVCPKPCLLPSALLSFNRSRGWPRASPLARPLVSSGPRRSSCPLQLGH